MDTLAQEGAVPPLCPCISTYPGEHGNDTVSDQQPSRRRFGALGSGSSVPHREGID